MKLPKFHFSRNYLYWFQNPLRSKFLVSILKYSISLTCKNFVMCAGIVPELVVFSGFFFFRVQVVFTNHIIHAFIVGPHVHSSWTSRSHLLSCNGKLWYSNINRFCNFDMFRNFVKKCNPMCDVALSMWLLFSLFPRNWQVLRQQRARTSKNTGAPQWQKPETARTSENRLFLRC